MSEEKETEKEAEKGKDKEKKPKKKGSFKQKLKVFLFVGAAVFFLKQSVIMLMVGLLPAFVAYIVDKTYSNSWFKTVFCFNLAAMLPYIAEVYFEQNNSASAMQAQMGDFFMWFVVYLSAGFAWVLIWACPQFAMLYLKGYHEYKAEEHRRKFDKLKKEWGIKMSLSD